jgi:hypothetical protein
MRVPFFFVVGAAKAGTTSVYHYLKQHPQIYVHPYKDVACFFCERYGLPISLEEFDELMTSGCNPSTLVAGDVCSDYLADPHAAEKIADIYPDAKIIIILRNPVDRAYSLYQWMVREGYEYLSKFQDALAAESERLARQLKNPDLIYPAKDAYLYFHSGLYSGQVQRYLDRFPRDRVLILLYDDLCRDSIAFMQGVYAFLGVRSNFVPAIRIYNEARQPWLVEYNYFCRRWLARVLPNGIVRLLITLNSRRSVNARLDQDLREELSRKYASDIKRTAAITGLNLDHWLIQ